MSARLLPGGRLHLGDGPIDLIVWADGEPDAIRAAYRAAIGRFSSVLDELCAELTLLRRPATRGDCPSGAIARRMWRAVLPHADAVFITPMAAVAGAVADTILQTMTSAAPLTRAFVNNGGDIALHLETGRSLTAGLVDRPDRPSLVATSLLDAGMGVRGVATSGWRGRSFSLGIADAVTILAGDPAAADACATLVANDVDLAGHPAISRCPACSLQPDSDLGDRRVTVAVGPLTAAEIDVAMGFGIASAKRLVANGTIVGAVIRLAGEISVIGETV